MTHDHSLEDIFLHGPEMEETVVRWCPTCGAVVIDVDIDGRTNPGAIMKMKFPESARARCAEAAESELQELRAKQQRGTELMRKLVNFVKDRNHCPESHNCAECEIIVPIYLEAEKLLADSGAQQEEKA